VRLRHARRRRHGQRRPRPAVHLPLTLTRGAAVAPPRATSRPRRRLVATAVLTPVLFTLLVAVGGGWGPGADLSWTVLLGLTAVGASVVLASYLPLHGSGLRPD